MADERVPIKFKGKKEAAIFSSNEDFIEFLTANEQFISPHSDTFLSVLSIDRADEVPRNKEFVALRRKQIREHLIRDREKFLAVNEIAEGEDAAESVERRIASHEAEEAMAASRTLGRG